MAAELDEMFEALSRQADAIALAGPEQARRRGRQRTATTMLSLALAILLTIAGITVGVQRSAQHTTPATPDGSFVPTVGKPVQAGSSPAGTGQYVQGITVASGELTYSVVLRYSLARRGNVLWIAGVDARTGKGLWPAWSPPITTTLSISYVVAGPHAFVVANDKNDLFAFDPATGGRLWDRPGSEAVSDVFTGKAIVELDRSKSKLTGIDWTTGRENWSAGIAGEPAYLVGMSDPQDGPPPHVGHVRTFTGNRVVVVTHTAHARLYETGTGALLSETAIGALPHSFMAANDGLLYTDDWATWNSQKQIIRATDLTGTGKPRVVAGRPAGVFQQVDACGPGRVCVLVKRGQDAYLDVYDAGAHRLLWERNVHDARWISSHRGQITLTGPGLGDSYNGVYDQNGQRLFGQVGDWIDDTTLLAFVPGSSPVQWALYSLTSHKLTVLGHPQPGLGGTCASTGDRLVCPADAGVTVYRLR